jgi:hypothetical protein
MTTNVISFPVQVSCPVCKRPCSDDDLSECYACGDKFCQYCSECSCDRLAAYLKDLKPGFWERVRALIDAAFGE